ncbi:hypothetical protein [Novacetimonas pomaceti]|uniref:hypothetical protein n=1 Tax=Novacetimonas pomaceti TaxID=2021998 RepID=UPI001057FDEF|nr:hypothetical protein [Novacetimonas pomaceti]
MKRSRAGRKVLEKTDPLFRGRVKTQKKFLVMLCEDAAFLKKGGTQKLLPVFSHGITAGLYPRKCPENFKGFW